MSSELQATQVNLLRHQRIEIQPNKSKQKQFNNKPGCQSEAVQEQDQVPAC